MGETFFADKLEFRGEDGRITSHRAVEYLQ